LGENRYGKENVRILRVVKDSPRHEVHELKAQILLEGDFDNSFTNGNNNRIIPTETQKNTLYALAKKFSVEPIEEWSINVANDMMSRFSHIKAVYMDIDEFPWERIKVGGKEHNHAFRKGSTGIRFCNVKVTRSGAITVTSGFRDYAVLKTTQSGFEGYIEDEYTTLQGTRDRVLCTKIQCSWTYGNQSKDGNIKKCLPSNSSVSYSQLYNDIQRIATELFAGDPSTGTYSPSVQQTIYDIGVAVIQKYASLDKVSFVLPNIHYYLVDFNQYKTNLKNNKEVFFTFDGAAGHIEGSVERSKSSTSRL